VDDLRDDVLRLETRLLDAFSDALAERRHRAEMAVLTLGRLSPRRAIDDHRQRVDDVMARAERALQGRLALQRARLAGLDKALSAISPLATLARGYAIVRKQDGQVVRRTADTVPGDAVDIRLHDGTLKARIEHSS
jgi:exodeoxyribonuclease VII large subunit